MAIKLQRKKKAISVLLICIITTGIVLSSLKERKRPNIILILVDTVRADHLGCYDYKRDTSPNIDTFAKNSTLYVNAFSQANSTIPSVYSLLTSLYPLQHKMNSWGSLIDHNITTLISVLHNNGYSIGVFGNQTLLLRSVKENFGDLLNEFRNSSFAPSVTKEALQWIESQKHPFFLWIYYLDPHRPYRPPPPHDNLYAFKSDCHLPIRNVEKDYIGGWDYIPNIIVENGIDNPNYYIAKYDGEIHYIDEEVGKLLKGLKEKGLFKSSLIIFTSDHGESLGEHHLYFNHLFTLFNELIKVPLIVKKPGQECRELIQENVALIDIFPTILKGVKIKMIKGIEGISLGKNPFKKRIIISYGKRMFALISDNWKFIKYHVPKDKNDEYIKIFFPEYPDETDLLFNIENDPLESINLSHINIIVCQKMKLDLCEHIRKMRLLTYKIKYSELDEDYKKKLKSLGYAQ